MKEVILNSIVLVLVFSCLPSWSFTQTVRVGPLTNDNVYPVQNFGEEHPRLLLEAQTHYQLFDQERTLFALDNAVLHNPNSVTALLARAQFKELIGLKTEAAQDFRAANQLNPYASNLYGMNGQNGLLNIMSFQPESDSKELSQDDRMNYYYDYLYKMIGEGKMDETELGMLEEVVGDIERNELAEALSALETLFRFYPNAALGYDLQGIVYTKQQQVEKAREAFKKAVELQPDLAIAWYNFSKFERSHGNEQVATEYLDRAIYHQADLTKAYFERAIVRKSKGDYKGALADYENVIARTGQNYVEAIHNRGLTRKMLGDFNGALSDLNFALRKYSDDALLYNNRGNIFVLLGYHQRAIKDYSKAIELNPDLAEAYYNRGLAYLIIQNRDYGCADLSYSAGLGYQEAKEKKKYFCAD